MNKEELVLLFKDYSTRDYKDEYRIYTSQFEDIIERILIKHKLEIAELEAKIYTYEKIIANSNFKAINNKTIDSLNKRIKEQEKEIDILKGGSNE